MSANTVKGAVSQAKFKTKKKKQNCFDYAGFSRATLSRQVGNGGLAEAYRKAWTSSSASDASLSTSHHVFRFRLYVHLCCQRNVAVSLLRCDSTSEKTFNQ